MILSIEDLNIFLGLSLDDARGKIAGYGYSSRLTRVDDRPMVVTRDYDPLRINLWIQANRVVKAYTG